MLLVLYIELLILHDIATVIYIKDLARAPEIVPSIFYFFQFFLFFRFFLDFFDFFARTVYITIQSDRVYIDI